MTVQDSGQHFVSRRTLVWRRFRRNRPAMVSAVVLVVLFVGCWALPPLLPYSYTDLDYYARARIDARIAQITPVVLELHRQGVRDEQVDTRKR